MNARASASRTVDPVEIPAIERNDGYRQLMQRPGDAFHVFEVICDAWELNQAHRRKLLGDIGRASYASWRSDSSRVRLSLLQIERIAQVTSIANHLLSIYAGARESANSWVNRPNRGALYGGRPPIELMTAGSTQDLIRVRADLAGWDGW